MQRLVLILVSALALAALLAIAPFREEAHWGWALRLNTAEAYSEYLHTWPDARHAADALRQQDELDWDATRAAASLEAFDRYLRARPEGAFIAQARGRIDDLRWQGALAANSVAALEEYLRGDSPGAYLIQARERIEDLHWSAALAADSVAALQDHIRAYPGGRHVAEARGQLDDLQWRRATETTTRPAFEAYLRAQPDGRHAAEARLRVEDLLWQTAVESDSPAPYSEYLGQYPAGRYAEQARERLASFRAPVPGATYTGRTTTGAAVRLAVGADGATITDFSFGTRAGNGPAIATSSCGVAVLAWWWEPWIHHIPVVAHGTSFTNPVGLGSSGVVPVFKATFADDGTVTGTLSLSFPTNPRCSSRDVAWSATVGAAVPGPALPFGTLRVVGAAAPPAARA